MPEYFNAGNLGPGELERFVERALAADRAALTELLQVMHSAAPMPDEQLARLCIPTLLLYGADDPLTPERYSSFLLRVWPHARITILGECGHSPMWERPAAWSDAVNEFLVQSGIVSSATACAEALRSP